jgi:hypothetical protein
MPRAAASPASCVPSKITFAVCNRLAITGAIFHGLAALVWFSDAEDLS